MDFDGRCIQDSTDLAVYLEEKYPEPSIYPGNPSDKGLCMILEDWADEDLNLAIRLIRNAEHDDARKAAENNRMAGVLDDSPFTWGILSCSIMGRNTSSIR